MTRPNRVQSTQLKVPVTDGDIESLKAENAILMRRLFMLTHSDIKLRAALECATGVPWDSEDLTELHGEALEHHIARNIAHGTGFSIEETKEKIAHHRRLANRSQVETAEGSLSQNPSQAHKNVTEIPTIGGKPAPNLH